MHRAQAAAFHQPADVTTSFDVVTADEFALIREGNIISDKVARVNLGVVSTAWWARKLSHIAQGSFA